MSSELAIVTAEIVDILPREQQTTEMANWVESQLAAGNTASEMLEYCKTQFGIVVHKIDACELKIQNQGIRLDSYIQKTDRQFELVHGKFDQVHSKIAKLETDLAVTTALSNERAQQQQFTNGQLMSSINNTNTNLTNGLTNVSKSGGETNPVALFFGLAFGVIIISCLVALGINPPSQVIEYKNVPSNGHPLPVPKDLYDKL